LNVGSLFSGIGGLDAGFAAAGWTTIWVCENAAYPAAVLRERFPGVPNLGDISTVDWSRVERPDVLAGGFPCQDTSIAGRGAGLRGAKSGLWFAFERAISALVPEWVVVENTPGLIRRGLDAVLAGLRRLGYHPCRPLLVTAAFVGARHKRERLFVVAYRRGQRHRASPEALRPRRSLAQLRAGWTRQPRVRRTHDGLPSRLDASRARERLKALGNAVVPQVATFVAEQIKEAIVEEPGHR